MATPHETADAPLTGIRPLLSDSSSRGIPPQTRELREARERVYNLYSAAIGACLSRSGTDPALAERARVLLEEEAMLPHLTPGRLSRLGDELPATIAELRAWPVRPPEGATPADPGRTVRGAELTALFDLALRDRLSGPEREHPRLLLFGGQPGSGKSTLQRLVLPVLPEGTVSYDGDDLLRLAPDYEWAMGEDDLAASHSLAVQVGGLHRLAMEHVRAGRVDVVCSHPLGRADWAAQWVEGFREAGYRVEAAFVATHASNSRFAIADRRLRSCRDQGFGRWITEDQHDRFYLGVPNTIEFLETHRLVDSLYVLSREGEVLYANHVGDGGRWRTEPFGRVALEAERGRRELWRQDDD
ncbi:zeta toxin family protein [Nocardiopsis sp. NRRL B-16309]|uniref:zeta toxin family protein n=1 Tax=Nocardiopsis sp. NRRL B-16309 TaxID=1519494 RepID=UPI0006AF2D43|nr:zeta toxin family protein [Nocardiopsis sp. NRRL B-16309]KOX16987.1 toxin [Nocardiopsis sp. NRRL B-16309]